MRITKRRLGPGLMPLLAVSLFLLGCGKAPETKEAIQATIVDYLNKREDGMGKTMDIQVMAVTFRGEEADADVQITPKGTTNGIRMPYTLKREGDKWVVQKKKTDAPNASPHAAPPTGEMPAGHPPISGAPTGPPPPIHAPK